MEKLIVISGPSGTGKTSIVHYLLNEISELSFSVSASNRRQRNGEQDGIDYHFLTTKEFKTQIDRGDFLEWEEVYPNQYYGTLRSEAERIWKTGKTVIFDVDVIGGLNIKKQYPETCLSIFIMPPSLDVLKERLKTRESETSESLQKRLKKSVEEIAQHQEFDKLIMNDNFEEACHKIRELVQFFLK